MIRSLVPSLLAATLAFATGCPGTTPVVVNVGGKAEASPNSRRRRDRHEAPWHRLEAAVGPARHPWA